MNAAEFMQTLLNAMKTEIEDNLTYLKWVGVVDSENLPPEETGFPFVGLKDGPVPRISQPGKKDIESFTVFVIPYQSITLVEPGGSVMGSETQLGDVGKGLLKIGGELENLLEDNFLNLNVHFAHLDRFDPTDPLVGEDGRLIQMQRYHFMYKRYA